jgi:hypothetical protein
MVLITVTGDHDRPERLITINGIRIFLRALARFGQPFASLDLCAV